MANIPALPPSSLVSLSGARTVMSGRTSSYDSKRTATDIQILQVTGASTGAYKLSLSSAMSKYELHRLENGEDAGVVAKGENLGNDPIDKVNLRSGAYALVVQRDGTDLPPDDYTVTLDKDFSASTVGLTREGVHVKGQTSQSGYRGLPQDSRTLQVQEGGEYNLTLNSPMTSFRIYNTRNELVASGETGTEPSPVKVKLETGSYRMEVVQQMQGTFGREYTMDLTPRSSGMITSIGGNVSGTVTATDNDQQTVQRHTVNILSDGQYSMNITLPYSTYSLVNSDGMTVASGFNGAAGSDLFMKSVTANLKAGAYELVLSAGGVESGKTGWQFNMTQPVKELASTESKLSKVQQILQEREAWLSKQDDYTTTSVKA